MSTDNNVSKRNNGKNSTKFMVLAGMLAVGLLASSIVGGQMLSAQAQQQQQQQQQQQKNNSDNHDGDEPMPVDLECETGAEVCEQQIEDAVQSVVSTGGTATVKVTPDKVSVTVGVETNGTAAEEAASSNAELVARVIAALRTLGIAEDQISTSSYDVYPVHSHSEPVNACRVMEGYPIPPECYVSGEEVVSYKAINTVTVTLDVDGEVDAGEVIDTAIEAGANNVNGVYFFISAERQEDIRDSLIGDAIDNARQRAYIAADAVGMEVSGVKSIKLNDMYFSVFSRGFDAAESASTPILPGEQQVSLTLSIIFYISGATDGNVDGSGSFGLTEPAMEFLLSKLPELGIVIDDELDIHMDMIAHISGNEYHVDFGVVDVNGQVHDGHIEVVDGEVAVAILDGGSIL